jgi:hypothetical protein
MIFTVSYLLLSWERTNSTQSCNNQPLSFMEQMVLIELVHNGWVSFQIKTIVLSICYTILNCDFSIMSQAWNWSAISICLYKLTKWRDMKSHQMKRHEISCLMENGANNGIETLYSLYSTYVTFSVKWGVILLSTF